MNSFSTDSRDSLSVLLNESAVKALGLKKPLGKKIFHITQQGDHFQETPFIVKGVIQDFNYETLHQSIKPLVIKSNEYNAGRMKYIVVKLRPGFTAKVIDQIKAKWSKLIPQRAFHYQFLDETLDAKYRQEYRMVHIFQIFSGISIFISCIGLFALSSYTVSLRTKEIGIRKVLGASTQSILLLISGSFTKLIFIAFILAVPIAWYLANLWLQDFAFRISIPLSIFILTGVLTLLITWLTVSWQSVKAALVNPIHCLKDE